MCLSKTTVGHTAAVKMLTAFELDGKGRLRPDTQPKTNERVLFGRHTGCGKSIELQQYAALFRHSYTVHHLALTDRLGIHNASAGLV